MERIRIGNDIAISWALFENNGATHLINAGGASVSLNCGGYTYLVPSFSVQGNVVSFIFPAEDQVKTGKYKIVLTERNESGLVSSYDVRDAFVLVPENEMLNVGYTQQKNVEITSVITHAAIANIKTISIVESEEEGGDNVVTFVLTDGSQFPMTVKNGSKGEKGDKGDQGIQGEKGDKGDTGARGPAGIDSVEAAIGTNDPTQAPSVDKELTEGVLSLTFNNIKGEKGDQGEPAVAVDNYVTVEATSSTTSATDVLPATGSADTVYRVSNWDGTQYNTNAYTEYGWYDGAYKMLATRTPGIDDEPTAGSQKLVKSGGVAAQVSQLGQEVIGIGKHFGATIPTPIPYEFEVGKSYYFVDKRAESGTGFTPIYFDGSNVQEFNLNRGATYLYTPQTAHHSITVVPTTTGQESNFIVFDAESVNGRLTTLENDVEQNSSDLQEIKGGSRINVAGTSIVFENGGIDSSGNEFASTVYLRTKGFLSVKQKIRIDLPSNIQTVGIAYYNASTLAFDHFDVVAQNAQFSMASASVYLIRIVVQKNNQSTISPSDVELFIPDSREIQYLERSVEALNETIDNTRIYNSDGSAVSVQSCKMQTGHTYIIYNTSELANYFGLWARVSQSGVDVEISPALSTSQSVEFTPTEDYNYIVLGAGMSGRACRIEIYDKESISYRLAEVEKSISNVRNLTTEGSSAEVFSCMLLKNRTYIFKNISEQPNYFGIYVRAAASHVDVTVTDVLAHNAEVSFTPQQNFGFVVISAGYQSRACKVSITETKTIDNRLDELASELNVIEDEFNARKTISPTVHFDFGHDLLSFEDEFLVDLIGEGNINWQIGNREKDTYDENGTLLGFVKNSTYNYYPLYMQQIYAKFDELVSAYPDYVSKVDLVEYLNVSGLSYPNYAHEDLDASKPLAYHTYMYILKPTNVLINETSTKLKKVLMMAGEHGEERSSIYALWCIAKALCTSMNDDYFRLRNACEVHFIPVLNGYGCIHSNEPGGVSGIGRLNYNLVNINLNYPTVPFVESGQGTVEYTGPYGGSEFETQLMINVEQKEKYDAIFDCHSNIAVASVAYFDLAPTVNTDNVSKARAMYDTCADISITYKKKYPEYYGVGGGLLPMAPSPRFLASTLGMENLYFGQQGVPVSVILESPAVIAFNNGVYEGSWHELYTDNIFSLNEYLFRIQLLHFVDWILKH